MSKDRFIYLAVPYSHSKDSVKNFRFGTVTAISGKLFEMGIFNFSPITHSHPVSLINGSGTSWETWEKFDKFMVDLCTEIWVLKLPGWEASVGVQAEIQHALKTMKPVQYLNVDIQDGVMTIKDVKGKHIIYTIFVREEIL